jgi:hypothetical protein
MNSLNHLSPNTISFLITHGFSQDPVARVHLLTCRKCLGAYLEMSASREAWLDREPEEQVPMEAFFVK